MFKFPKNLYTDVRIEDVFETRIKYRLGEIQESKVRTYKAAFIRVFDGNRWYYGSTSDVNQIQNEIDKLATYTNPNEDIAKDPLVEKLHINKETRLNFVDNSITNIDMQEKDSLLQEFFPVMDNNSYLKNWSAHYIERRVEKEFYSCKGAELNWDTQIAGLAFRLGMADGDKRFQDSFQIVENNFDGLKNRINELEDFVDQCQDFLLNSEPVEQGKYTVILSPTAAGVFAHESFGHKSEADFMIGDETMKKAWAIGKEVGTEILSIVDDGNLAGSGYVPFDDEGTKAEETYLIKDGILNDRLHSALTATSLEENLTSNARAKDFEFEPIVRMTTTYIQTGDKTKEELFSEVEEGIYIDTIKYGTGMSTFTIAPSLAYYIKDGKIAKPVNISVISGNVMETLGEIDGLSNELEIISSVTGGCGKMEQHSLPVGFGGPYVRVKNINVQ
mgnify:CR=1 FL=1